MGDKGIGILILILVLMILSLIILLAVSYINNRGNRVIAGLLKISGFSTKSATSFFVLKSLLLLIPSVVVGLFLGLMLALFISENISGLNHIEGTVEIISLCAIVITVFSLFFNFMYAYNECRKPIIENLKPIVRDKSQVSHFYTGKNPVLLYSVRNFIMNGRETAFSSVMVFSAAFIIFIALTVTSATEIALCDLERPYDLYFSFPEQAINIVGVRLNHELGITESEYNAIKNSPDTLDVLALKRFELYVLTHNEVDYTYLGENGYDAFMDQKEALSFPDGYNLQENRLYSISIIVARIINTEEPTMIIDARNLNVGAKPNSNLATVDQ